MGVFTATPKTSATIELPRYISAQQHASMAEQMLDITRELEALVHGREQSELAARPNADSWSVAECLDH